MTAELGLIGNFVLPRLWVLGSFGNLADCRDGRLLGSFGRFTLAGANVLGSFGNPIGWGAGRLVGSFGTSTMPGPTVSGSFSSAAIRCTGGCRREAGSSPDRLSHGFVMNLDISPSARMIEAEPSDLRRGEVSSV